MKEFEECIGMAENFIYRNARPVDLARWNQLMKKGSADEVVRYLRAYQNEDGGFGSALEADCWNPNSSPVQTWAAARIIEEINFSDKEHPLVKGIIKYLCSGKEFSGKLWHGLSAVKSNDNYPHAPWWSCTQKAETSYNPSASLIGFILKYSEKKSAEYEFALSLLQDAYNFFRESSPLDSMHEALCFVELYDYLDSAEIFDAVSMEKFEQLISVQIRHNLTTDVGRWKNEYVCKPSFFSKINSRRFIKENPELIEAEKKFIIENQNKDGTWNVTWKWNDFAQEWALSENWWKSDIIISNIRFLLKTE